MLYLKKIDDEIIYPYTIDRLKKENPQTCFPEMITCETLRSYNVFPVEETTKPEEPIGQIYENLEGAEGVEVEIEDQLYSTKWTLRNKTQEEFQSDKDIIKSEINRKLDEEFQKGFSVPFGAMQGKILQTRNIEDRTNWLTSQAAYSAAVASGNGSIEGASFRTEDNLTFNISYSEGLDVLLTMAAWGKSIMSNSWALKDRVEEATTFQELNDININEGWNS